MNMSLVVDGLDVGQLTDEELSERLQSYGFISGPIVDTTRVVYQRKLARLMRKEELHLSESEEMEEAQEGEEEAETRPQLVGLSSPSTFSYEELRRRPLPRAENSWESSPSRYTSASDIVTQVEPPPETAGSSNLPFILKSVCLIFAVLFVFLIYHNMESAVDNPVPSGL